MIWRDPVQGKITLIFLNEEEIDCRLMNMKEAGVWVYEEYEEQNYVVFYPWHRVKEIVLKAEKVM